MPDENIVNFGPLAALAGVWEGDQGEDTAPSSADRSETARSQYRERLVLEPMGRVDNHDQGLYALQYATPSCRIGADEPFHKEVGYWLWDAAAEQVLRCFLVPRGVSIIAGGTVEPDAKTIQLAADVGSETYGICSNLFLDQAFKTVRCENSITIHDENRFSYTEDTQLRIAGQDELYHHTDTKTLRRVQ